jgi:hypothetical protein
MRLLTKKSPFWGWKGVSVKRRMNVMFIGYLGAACSGAKFVLMPRALLKGETL